MFQTRDFFILCCEPTCLNPSLAWETKQHKRASLDCPTWAGQGWCLEMINWRQPPISHLSDTVLQHILILHLKLACISGDNVQHNSLLGWGLGCLVLNQRDEKPCGTGVHCGESSLEMFIAVYVGDKPVALERSQVIFWIALWKSAEDDDDQVLQGFVWGLGFSLPVFLYSRDVKLVFLLTVRP